MTSDVASFKLEGTIVPTLTPMKSNGDVNYEAIEPYCQYLSDIGASGLFVNGTMGEGMSMTVEERKHTAETWVKAAKGRVKHVVIQVGTANLRDTITLAKHAESIGADAVASICSVYFRPQNLEQLLMYIEKVAAAVPDLPYYYYDFEYMTGVSLDMVRLMELAKDRIPNLRGMKYTNTKVHVASLIGLVDGGRFQVLVGTNDVCLPHLCVGLDITIPDTSFTSLHVQLKKAYSEKDFETARKLQNRITELSRIFNGYLGTPTTVAKEICTILTGLDMRTSRLPMVQLSKDQVDRLNTELQQVGYFDWIVKKKSSEL